MAHKYRVASLLKQIEASLKITITLNTHVHQCTVPILKACSVLEQSSQQIVFHTTYCLESILRTTASSGSAEICCCCPIILACLVDWAQKYITSLWSGTKHHTTSTHHKSVWWFSCSLSRTTARWSKWRRGNIQNTERETATSPQNEQILPESNASPTCQHIFYIPLIIVTLCHFVWGDPVEG